MGDRELITKKNRRSTVAVVQNWSRSQVFDPYSFLLVAVFRSVFGKIGAEHMKTGDMGLQD